MKKCLIVILSLIYPFIILAQKELTADGINVILDDKLSIVSIYGDREYYPDGLTSYLVSIKSGNKIIQPEKATWKGSELTVMFPNKSRLILLCTELKDYLRFEVVGFEREDLIETLLFGPFPITLDETIGEIVGVVREGGYAIGLQSLSAKTTGGKQVNLDGSDPSRGSTASAEDHGSSLQAYCINRNRVRVHPIWNNRVKDAVVPANEDGNLIGASIALFGCSEADVLKLIEKIEINEKLPHSTINGQWSKTSPDANKPYFITTFTEENIDEVIEYTKVLGYNALYHSHPFETWGHFELIEDQFPNGWGGMKSCVDKAAREGVRLGAHTLTNFITTNDPFVSPVPHQGLMIYCRTNAAKEITETDNEIYLENPEGYSVKDDCQAIRIGDEIIRFSGVSEDEPYRLINCRRGQYGTKKASHPINSEIARLVDHPYKVFFPDWNMQKEMISNLADFFNYTGLGQLDFDGHEGGWGSGEGEFGMDYFSQELQKQVKHELRNGSSRSNHFYWHTVSYINWGEPWYGGFTKSQGHYRYQNQALLKRNYIPNMLGWFLLNATTTLQEFEYMLARSAGFDAGYALYSTIENFKSNPEFDKITEAINIWEDARLGKIFNSSQLELLQDVNNDFSLSRSLEDEYLLQYYSKTNFELLNEIVQPGQPNDVQVEFNVDEDQALYLVLGAVGSSGSINAIEIEYNGFETYKINTELKPNWAIIYRGGDELLVYDEVGRLKTKLDFSAAKIILRKGSNRLRVSAQFSVGDDIKLNGYVRLKDKIEKIVID